MTKVGHRAVGVIKWLLAGMVTLLVWILLAKDGWNAISRDPLQVTPAADVVALSIDGVPAISHGELSLKVGFDSGDPTAMLRVSLTILNYKETAAVHLVLAGRISRSQISCAETTLTVPDPQGFNTLQPGSKSAIKWQLSDQDVKPGESRYGAEYQADLTEQAQKESYVELGIKPTRDDYWTDPNAPGNESSGPTEKHTQRVYRSNYVANCRLRDSGLWAFDPPEQRVDFPNLLLVRTEEQPQVRYEDNVAIYTTTPLTPALTLSRFSSSPSRQAGDIACWQTTLNSPYYQSDCGSTTVSQRGINETGVDGQRSVSAVLVSSSESSKQQQLVFKAGVGLGVIASLIVWMLSSLFDGAVSFASTLRRRTPLTEPTAPVTIEQPEANPDQLK